MGISERQNRIILSWPDPFLKDSKRGPDKRNLGYLHPTKMNQNRATGEENSLDRNSATKKEQDKIAQGNTKLEKEPLKEGPKTELWPAYEDRPA